jgi:ADP-ribose pyrophosphatase YjhB (NUDIX family)
VLARGPWALEQVTARWREEHFEPSAAVSAAADAAITELRERGSPSHDGEAARLVDHSEAGGRLHLELQPVRWSLRLVPEEAEQSISALCVVRAADGRWLAGRRAAWLAAWAGRWALGAGGAVEVGENPAETLGRELEEEWSVVPERLSVEALVRVPSGLVLLVGLAWLPEGAEVTPDEEHDAFDWWPADPAQWPDHADPPLRLMAGMLAGGG